jgi:hypothetical protein
VKKVKPGRQRVPKKLAKGSLLSVRFSESEREALDAAAERMVFDCQSGQGEYYWTQAAEITATWLRFTQIYAFV